MELKDLHRLDKITYEVSKRRRSRNNPETDQVETTYGGIRKLSIFDLSFLARMARRYFAESRGLEAKAAELDRKAAALHEAEQLVDVAKGRNEGCSHVTPGVIDERIIELFRGFYIIDSQKEAFAEAINRATRLEHQRGFAEGSNVLGRLSRGDMTVLDFERTLAEEYTPVSAGAPGADSGEV